MEENSKLLGIFQAAGHAVLGLGLRVSGLGHSNDGSRTGIDELLTEKRIKEWKDNGNNCSVWGLWCQVLPRFVTGSSPEMHS